MSTAGGNWIRLWRWVPVHGYLGAVWPTWAGSFPPPLFCFMTTKRGAEVCQELDRFPITICGSSSNSQFNDPLIGPRVFVMGRMNFLVSFTVFSDAGKKALTHVLFFTNESSQTHSGWSSVSSPTVTCSAIHPAAHRLHNGWVRSGFRGSLAMLMLPICGPLLSSKVLEAMQVY